MSEYLETLHDYQKFITTLTARFPNLPPEEWGQLEPFLPLIEDVGKSLVIAVTNIQGRKAAGVQEAHWTPPIQGQVEAATHGRHGNLRQSGKKDRKEQKETLKLALNFAANTARYLEKRREILRLDWLEMGLTASRLLKLPRRVSHFLNDIGLVHYSLGDKQKGLTYYNQSLSLSESTGDFEGYATTLHNIGCAYWSMGKQEEALEYLNQALSVKVKLADPGSRAVTLSTMGLVYREMHNKEKALALFEEALVITKSLGKLDDIGTILNNIGLTYSYTEEKEKALEYYAQSLGLSRQVGDLGGEGVILNNIGLVYNSLGRKEEALQSYDQALTIHRLVRDRQGEGQTLNNVAQVYSSLGEKKKALHLFEQALNIRREVEDKRGESVTCYNISLIYKSWNELEEAIAYMARCVELDIELNHPDFTSDQAELADLQSHLPVSVPAAEMGKLEEKG